MENKFKCVGFFSFQKCGDYVYFMRIESFRITNVVLLKGHLVSFYGFTDLYIR